MRWSPKDHAVRDFLSRNRIPYQWLNPEQNPEALTLLKEKGADDHKLPVVLFGDGTALVQPTSTDLAHKLGMPTQAQQKFYDIVVVGAGPAGLAAGVYGASEGPEDTDRRTERSRRTGGIEFEDRELSRLPFRPQRRGTGEARLPAGDATWSRIPAATSDLYSIREQLPGRRDERWSGDHVPCLPDCDRCGLLHAERSSSRTIHRCRCLLRCGVDRKRWPARTRRCTLSAEPTQQDRQRCISHAMPIRCTC